jgi:hypothetical protein
VRLEGLGQLKNPMTSSGIEPATFQLVTQCLNQLRYRVPSRRLLLLLNIYGGIFIFNYNHDGIDVYNRKRSENVRGSVQRSMFLG